MTGEFVTWPATSTFTELGCKVDGLGSAGQYTFGGRFASWMMGITVGMIGNEALQQMLKSI